MEDSCQKWSMQQMGTQFIRQDVVIVRPSQQKQINQCLRLDQLYSRKRTVRNIFVTLVEDETTIPKRLLSTFLFSPFISNWLILFNRCTYVVCTTLLLLTFSIFLLLSFFLSPSFSYGSDSCSWLDAARVKISIFRSKPMFIDNNKIENFFIRKKSIISLILSENRAQSIKQLMFM